jgi:hypothetical protein
MSDPDLRRYRPTYRELHVHRRLLETREQVEAALEAALEQVEDVAQARFDKDAMERFEEEHGPSAPVINRFAQRIDGSYDDEHEIATMRRCLRSLGRSLERQLRRR